MLKITESVKAEIEAATGQTIPDPQSAEFEAFIERLERDHPELAKKLEDALEVTEPFPEEEAQQNAKRRESIAQTINKIFFKEVWGHDVLNRRALKFILFFLIFGTVATSWTVMLLRRPEQNLATAQTTAPVPPTQPVEEVTQPPETTTDKSAPQETPLLVVPEPQEQPENNAPPNNLITSVPEPARDIPLYTGEVPQPPTPEVPNMNDSGEQPAVSAFETLQEGLESSPVLAFEKETVAAPVLAFEETAQIGESSLTLEEEEQGELSPVLADGFIAENSDEVALQEIGADSSNPDALTASPILAFEETDEVAKELSENASPLDAPAAANTETTVEGDEVQLLETDVLEPETDTKNLLQAGQLIPATLVKDIVLAEGETKQVIADSEANWCGEECPSLRWLGEATLSSGGRLEVQFHEAILDGEAIELSGVAYGDDNAQGLPAHIADATPTLLADLLRSSAGGVTDYVEAQTNQRRVTSDEDTTVTEESVPPLLDFILGRAAGTLQMPEDETSVIRLAAVEKGTKLEVLYLEK
jgi:hypothetical protein